MAAPDAASDAPSGATPDGAGPTAPRARKSGRKPRQPAPAGGNRMPLIIGAVVVVLIVVGVAAFMAFRG